jgi:hypothetical protein
MCYNSAIATNNLENDMATFEFHNTQRCLLARIVAKSRRSAWAKFRRTWQTDGVTCEEV